MHVLTIYIHILQHVYTYIYIYMYMYVCVYIITCVERHAEATYRLHKGIMLQEPQPTWRSAATSLLPVSFLLAGICFRRLFIFSIEGRRFQTGASKRVSCAGDRAFGMQEKIVASVTTLGKCSRAALAPRLVSTFFSLMTCSA